MGAGTPMGLRSHSGPARVVEASRVEDATGVVARGRTRKKNKGLTKMSKRSCGLRWLLGYPALPIMAALLLAVTAPAAESFDKFGPRSIQAVVSADLMQGPHYRIAATVQTYDFLNDFITSSDYGVFESRSDAMLRRLLREIPAIASLRQISTGDAYAKAVEQAALGSVRGVEGLVTQPVQTLENVPTAVFDVFSRSGAALNTAAEGQKTAYEDSASAQLLQMSSYKRDYAKRLGVDPYSTNPVLQKELDSVSWAAAVGNLTVGAASMAAGGPVMAALSAARNLDQAANIVASLPPAELALRDQAAMRRMGIDNGLAQQFMGQRQFSPRHKYVLLTALDAMTGTAGRVAVIRVSLEAPNEQWALFYQQMAELLDGYNDRVSPIVSIERFNRLILAHDQTGKAIVIAPIDYMIWNERVASVTEEMAKRMQLSPGGNKFELWITGTASPLFKGEAEARGIRVKDHVSAVLPLLD
jgi:hypothetical protein